MCRVKLFSGGRGGKDSEAQGEKGSANELSSGNGYARVAKGLEAKPAVRLILSWSEEACRGIGTQMIIMKRERSKDRLGERTTQACSQDLQPSGTGEKKPRRLESLSPHLVLTSATSDILSQVIGVWAARHERQGSREI